MKALLKELGFEELPMFSEFAKDAWKGFVKSDDACIQNTEQLRIIHEYREFIAQPFTKGMFVPYSEDGEIMPEEKYLGLAEWDKALHNYRVEYQQAKDRVLFEGDWEIEGDTFKSKGEDIEVCFARCQTTTAFVKIHLYKTIEQAINAGVKLTLRAQS